MKLQAEEQELLDSARGKGILGAMGKTKSKCTKSKKPKPRPKLGGKKAKFVCDRCGMNARGKKDVCKPTEK